MKRQPPPEPGHEKIEAEKEEARVLMRQYLGVVKGQFYTSKEDEKRFYKHRNMIVQAIATPAKALKSLGVWLPPDRIRSILNEVLKGIKQKGNTDGIKHFGAYFLHCVQAHMKHRQEQYYNEGKTARAKAVSGMPLDKILERVSVVAEETPAQTVDRLVEIADVLKPRRRQKTVAKQGEFDL